MKALKEVQEKLNSLGYGPLTVDGKPGPKTSAAIAAFQAKAELKADGIYGPNTEAKLFPESIVTVTTTVSTPVPATNKLRDAVTEERINQLHPKIRNEVRSLLLRAEASFPKNIAVRVVQGLRTFQEQNELYSKGRRGIKGEGVVTNARGGKSYHNYGLAIDFALLYDKDNNGTYETLSWDLIKDLDRDGQADWMEVVKLFEATPGWGWGGRWTSIKDNPHFEKTFGFTTSQLLAKYNNKNFVPRTTYVNL
jgi:peptidoglycan LD-endopeptidase CwlK